MRKARSRTIQVTRERQVVRPSHEKYDAAFVKRVLDADAKPPEAKFANLIDMMDWLDRD